MDDDIPSDELRADLSVYGNAEILFEDPLSEPLRLTIYDKARKAAVLRIEIDLGELYPALDGFMFRTVRNVAADMSEEEFAQYREEIKGDPAYVQIAEEILVFWVRHFPKLVLRLYDILANSAVAAASINKWRQEPDEDLSGAETKVRETIEKMIAGMEKDIKAYIDTRQPGRPAKVETGPVPEFVFNVLRCARSIMGDQRGLDAVPRLKTIAVELGTNEAALGTRLRAAGHPWTRLKVYLSQIGTVSEGNSD